MTDSDSPPGMSVEGPRSDPPETPPDQEVGYPICGGERRQSEGVCTRPRSASSELHRSGSPLLYLWGSQEELGDLTWGLLRPCHQGSRDLSWAAPSDRTVMSGGHGSRAS